MFSSCLTRSSKALIFMASCYSILFSFWSLSILMSAVLKESLIFCSSSSLMRMEVSWVESCCLSWVIWTSALFKSSNSLFPSTILLLSCSLICICYSSLLLWSYLSASFYLRIDAISWRFISISWSFSLIALASCSLVFSNFYNC